MEPFPEEGRRQEYNKKVNRKMRDILKKTEGTVFWTKQQLAKCGDASESAMCLVVPFPNLCADTGA